MHSIFYFCSFFNKKIFKSIKLKNKSNVQYVHMYICTYTICNICTIKRQLIKKFVNLN